LWGRQGLKKKTALSVRLKRKNKKTREQRRWEERIKEVKARKGGRNRKRKRSDKRRREKGGRIRWGEGEERRRGSDGKAISPSGKAGERVERE